MGNKKKISYDERLSKADSQGNYYNKNGRKVGEKFGRIYASMMESYAWLDLSMGARYMLLVMSLQIKSDKYLKNKIDSHAIYFNKALAERHGFKNGKQRRKYIQELIDHGFIKRHPTKPNTKSVFILCASWKLWEDGKIKTAVEIQHWNENKLNP